MIFSTDQLGNNIKLNSIPKRVISIVPSQTELLIDLGLQDKLIGITKFCIHPKAICKQIEKVGGTKQLNLEKIKSLNPDLIIANKEENDRQQIEELQKFFPVWISDIYDLEDALQMISNLGLLFEKQQKATEMINQINLNFSSINKLNQSNSVCYLIWNKPMMAAGRNTFIHAMLDCCGFTNVITGENLRYPELTEKELIDYQPDCLLLSSEPFPFKETHIDYFKSILPNAKITLVDGEAFSWYGSRLLKATNVFEKLIKKLKNG
jgi:ABC-type Fe3+-hydroxamate transport system substrate-binding protein